jgi:hypothetical protein
MLDDACHRFGIERNSDFSLAWIGLEDRVLHPIDI